METHATPASQASSSASGAAAASAGGSEPFAARCDVPGLRESALSAAGRLLASTAEAIGPDTPASELLACLMRYRMHLSALVAISQAKAPLAPR